ncbi:IS3 family transposase [Streptomyces microflavus]|uniref:IS3 family transposase n=1 Tax=Streptomyces microflavus TaxID=1919 RepID=UPI003665699D
MIDHLRNRGLGVDPVRRVLELSPSTYFARKKRPKSARRLRDETLMPLIEEIHAEPGGTYGARRITRALRRKGVVVARCTVERLMAELGLEGVIRGRRRRTTVPEPSAPRPPDLVDRDFTASRPDQLWVADMTYVRTWPGPDGGRGQRPRPGHPTHPRQIRPNRRLRYRPHSSLMDEPRPSPSPTPARWKPFASCVWPARPRSRPEPRRSTNSSACG